MNEAKAPLIVHDADCKATYGGECTCTPHEVPGPPGPVPRVDDSPAAGLLSRSTPSAGDEPWVVSTTAALLGQEQFDAPSPQAAAAG